ncbi:MAG: glycoside hydrolase family 9 protein, partial [Paludibacteraceae bacterium]|nr:glycoside hydrolase family 9 protein [Paludibacteraceae bacterium]
GYLVGGPSLDQTSDCGNSVYPTVKYPAKTYLDMSCSYSTNEIALNWNAPLVSLISQIANAYK